MTLPPSLTATQQIVVTPDVGGRLILTSRTGLGGAREWVEHAAATRGASTFQVDFIDGDQSEDLGSVSVDEVGEWP